MRLRSVSSYVGELKPLLSVRAFRPAHSRLLWLPAHVIVIVCSMLAIAHGGVPWPLLPLLSLVIGLSLAGLVFLGHETLHGAIVRNTRLRYALGWCTFLPFAVSPRLWIAWHNRVHHGNANLPGVDPDAYPTLTEHRESRVVRVVTDSFAIGRRRLSGAVSLLIGFSVQSFHMLLVARKRGYLRPEKHWLALAETGLGLAFWAGLLVLFGPLRFVIACLLPIVVANVVVMAHILTNHALSPHTAVNDPLANSLSVTVPRWAEWFTLGFGHHVEHHLFPWMSARHAGEVRTLIAARWPERYQSMPLWRALRELHRTPRVYVSNETLLDPRTGQRWSTLSSTSSITSLSPGVRVAPKLA